MLLLREEMGEFNTTIQDLKFDHKFRASNDSLS